MKTLVFFLFCIPLCAQNVYMMDMNVRIVTDTTYDYNTQVIWGIDLNEDICFMWNNITICFNKSIPYRIERTYSSLILRARDYIEYHRKYPNIVMDIYTNDFNELYLITFIQGDGITITINRLDGNRLPCYHFSMVLKD